MFDQLVAVAEASGSVGAWARVESAACARRLAAMVVLLDACRAADGSADREQWCLDNWGAVSAQIGSAQQITTGAASHQLLVASALRDRLPRLAAVFADGLVSYRVIASIVFRTLLITAPDAVRAVDSALAHAVRDWAPMSEDKLTEAIDYWVDRFDPYAVRRTQRAARGRSVDVHAGRDGMTTVWATLFDADAEVFDQRLDALAATVCKADPRTLDQRRADAMGTVALGADRLACRCDQPDCPAVNMAPAQGVVIHVVVDEETLTDQSPEAQAQDEGLDGEAPPHFDADMDTLAEAEAEALAAGRRGEPAATRPALMLTGRRLLAGPIVRRLARSGTLRRIVHPGQAPPEPRYTPSNRLAEFIRCRDMTCRFPNCDEPATHCDIDHTIAHPVGPTQASNLKCLCRRHHLLKTFWSGPGGWRDRQLADGTVDWHAPDGQTYTTRPGSHLMFPTLCRPTARVVCAPAGQSVPATGLTMPRRQRTRSQDRRQRIDAERKLNQADPPAHWAQRREPAPF